MRIAYLVSDWGMAVVRNSGSTVHISQMCKALQDLGHEVFIVAGWRGDVSSTSDPFPDIYELRPNTKWLQRKPKQRSASTYSRPSQAEARLAGTSWSLKNVVRDLSADLLERLWRIYFYLRAARLMRRLEPDAIYERYTRDGDAGTRLGRKLEIPVILEVNASRTFKSSWRSPHSPLYELLVRRSETRNFARADRVLTMSAYLKDYVVSLGIDETKVETVHNAIDPSSHAGSSERATEARRQHGLSAKTVIGFVGSFSPWIDLPLLIDCVGDLVATHPELHLLLIGDGDLRATVSQSLTDRGLTEHATLLGHVPHAEIPALLAAMDITTAPYVPMDHFHFSPLKLFEYMAAGTAVVASRYPETEEVISDGESGLLVDPGSHDSMLRALVTLIEDEALRRRLGERARSVVNSSYTWEARARRTIALFSDVETKSRHQA